MINHVWTGCRREDSTNFKDNIINRRLSFSFFRPRVDIKSKPVLLPPFKTEPHSHVNVTDLALPVASFCPEDFATKERIEKSDIKNKIPADAQTTTVLVGAHDGLSCTVSAFVRLAYGCELGNFAEVNPVRFMFVLLGPDDENVDYHEVGRSISTLMSDKIFLDSAYNAKVREVKNNLSMEYV